MSTRIHLAKGPAEDLFKGKFVKIGGGVGKIDITNGEVKFPTMTMDNAARLSAVQIYTAMSPSHAITNEAEWLNKVSFADDKHMDTPAVRVVDNRVSFNIPPFKNSKKNETFWLHFGKYWYIMVVKAMQRALINRDKTAKEKYLINQYAHIEL